MMRSSSLVCKEMQGKVQERIPWRLSLGVYRGQQEYCFGKMKEGVRDLEIRWNLPDEYNKRPLNGNVRERLEELQLDRCRRRGRCVVWIERESQKSTWFEVDEIAALSRLQGFEEIIIRVTGPVRLSSHKIELVVIQLRPWLERAWGKCQQRQEGKDILLLFWPREEEQERYDWDENCSIRVRV